MFGKNTRVSIDPSAYVAEAAERARRESDERVASIRQRQLAFDTAQREAAERRHQRELEAGTAQREAVQERVSRQQKAQAAWAVRRDSMRSEISSLHTAIQDCESTMDGTDMTEAAKAAAERQVFERRLKQAETDYASHLRTSPM